MRYVVVEGREAWEQCKVMVVLVDVLVAVENRKSEGDYRCKQMVFQTRTRTRAAAGWVRWPSSQSLGLKLVANGARL
jgi:hypothetical protein